LQKGAHAIAKPVPRPADLVARYGGEEFAVILPNTNIEGAVQVAENIQREIRRLRLPHASSPVSPYITVSLGIASTSPHFESHPAELIANADNALYKAKAAGRDKYYIITSQPE